jgi:CheY-like chemotaxis protein
MELGYTVIPATSPAEALKELRIGASIDVLVTDYLMPQMNGAQLAAEARRLKPNLPILLITGYSNIDRGPGSELARLAKPFRHADLARKMHELLGER